MPGPRACRTRLLLSASTASPASSRVKLELVNHRCSARPSNLEPEAPGGHGTESDLLMKHRHRPVVKGVLRSLPLTPCGHIRHLLPLTPRLHFDLESVDVRELTLVPALEEDRPADAPLDSEIDLDPRLLRLAVRLPVRTHVSIGHRPVQGGVHIRGPHRSITIDRDLADRRDVLGSTLHFQDHDGGWSFHIIRTDVDQQRILTLCHLDLAAIEHVRPHYLQR